jgi:hypothetical protein
VDPEGCPFISVGSCSVNLSGFPLGTADKEFGGTTQWAERTLRLLKECGFDTLGRWIVCKIMEAYKPGMLTLLVAEFSRIRQRRTSYGKVAADAGWR